MSQEQLLESRMVTYTDLLLVQVKDNQEPMVAIKNEDILNGYLPNMSDMASSLRERILVRLTVYEKLKQAQKALKRRNEDFVLFVTYGYRSLEVQTIKFLEQLRQISEQTCFNNPVDLYEEVHRFIAVPIVAGHPTGGAIDVTMVNSRNNQFLDFGSSQYDFSNKDCYTFAQNITRQAKRNRLLLRFCMMEAGFAPFDGEWWHFSYGDREWAFYYKRPNAIYDKLPEEKVKDLVI